MKNLLSLCLLALLFTSCKHDKPIKIISTGERDLITDWDNLYKSGDTIIVFSELNYNNWYVKHNWSTKKDTIIYTTTYRVAVITK